MALTIGTLNSGLQGIQNGMAQANKAAAEIASTNQGGAGDSAGLAASLVDLKASEHLVKASTAVVRSADEMLGTLIDTQA
jgi:hypothetical protein